MSKDNDSFMDVDEAEIGQTVRSEISCGIFHSSYLSSLQGIMSIVEDNEDDRMDIDEAEIDRMVSSKFFRRTLYLMFYFLSLQGLHIDANGYDCMDIDGIGRDELVRTYTYYWFPHSFIRLFHDR